MLTFDEITKAFKLPGKLHTTTEEYGGGHINSTSLIQTKENDIIHKFIVQKINTSIFLKPDLLMDNALRVTDHLQKIILKDGGDPTRETLHFLPTESGEYFKVGSDGEFWRVYEYVDNTFTLQTVEDPQAMYSAGKAFAIFNVRLDDFPVEELHVTIPDFYNTPKRFQYFKEVVEKDVMGRLNTCRDEVDFLLSREKDTSHLTDLLDSKILPLRVTHNDTKINNILFDNDTKQGICVIDLDTVMPGLMAYDFGDAIRFGASTALEDETDLDKVHFSVELYEAFTKGFLEILAPILGREEKLSLPWGARLMTFEVGMRFLTDYLEGDVYFKINSDRPQHNLERARTQLKLVAEMEEKWEEMNSIIELYS